jgi:hypothetical protein
MSQVIYKDIVGELCLLPLNNVQFLTTDGSYNNEYNFAQIDNESSFKITPVERQTSKGGSKTIGWNYELNLTILQNNLPDLLDVLEEIKNYCDSFELDFGSLSPTGHDYTEFPLHINSNHGFCLIAQPTQKPGITYETQTMELGIKIIIHVKGMAKQFIIESGILGLI